MSYSYQYAVFVCSLDLGGSLLDALVVGLVAVVRGCGCVSLPQIAVAQACFHLRAILRLAKKALPFIHASCGGELSRFYLCLNSKNSLLDRAESTCQAYSLSGRQCAEAFFVIQIV